MTAIAGVRPSANQCRFCQPRQPRIGQIALAAGMKCHLESRRFSHGGYQLSVAGNRPAVAGKAALVRTVVASRMIVVATVLCGSLCAPIAAQVPVATTPAAPPPPATIDGCQVVARVNGQVVLGCELLWHVNRMLEANGDRIPPEQFDLVREQLMRRQLVSNVDTKLLYAEFRRNIPPENIPRIEENLLAPFEEKEIPRLMEQLEVGSHRELEQELARLGSSLDDTRRAFNEKVIASEWVRTKVTINEEVTPDELLTYYQTHATDFDFPTQARWEELMVRKDRFPSPGEAYAELARLGNQAWQKVAANPQPGTPIFTELAKVKSDGFNAKDGGTYDWTTQGALKAQAIDEALFSLEVGRLSPILESETGFHIVRVLEHKAAGRKPFTEVQNDIRDKLKDERFRVAVEKYLDELRRDARIWTVYTGPVSADVLLGRPPGDTRQR